MVDYIEREAAIREMYKEPSYYDPVNILTEVRDRIKAIPAADVRPVVRGDWEDAKQRGLCRCSACKDCYIEKDYITQAKWRYCPNCGAKMDVTADA